MFSARPLALNPPPLLTFSPLPSTPMTGERSFHVNEHCCVDPKRLRAAVNPLYSPSPSPRSRPLSRPEPRISLPWQANAAFT
jgi:hypothetical protein